MARFLNKPVSRDINEIGIEAKELVVFQSMWLYPLSVL